MKISEIDKNLNVHSGLDLPDVIWFNAAHSPFDLYGASHGFSRLPPAVAQSVSPGVAQLCLNTAGVRIRFCTDSPYIAIKAEFTDACHMPHMPLLGSAGFDLFCDDTNSYVNSFIPPTDIVDTYSSVVWPSGKGKRCYTLNFPLYSSVSTLYIGLKSSCLLDHGGTYAHKLPIIFYGSSITQGGCTSRPGNSYEGIISRALDCDYVNLGFSGSCLAEESIAKYMSGLKASVFVSDYDHNAPDSTHLSATHERLYRIIRAAQPYIPYVMISRPNFDKFHDVSVERRKIIRNTYINAINSGDKNVYFVDGEQLFGKGGRDLCTVDGTHPNDLGFYRMAEHLIPVLSPLIGE